ncbi:MAG TPA: kynureninase, partial [Bacteroidia bacterium]|nr:kynureninase [Bacteroidia bacterium]
ARGARSWQQSNAPVFSMAALRASLDVFSKAGMMEPLRKKSLELTGYLEYIVVQVNRQHQIPPVTIITPSEPAQRGCQLSMIVRPNGRKIFEALQAHGVIVDWREPDVIRAAPVPLYNSFEDVYRFGQLLESALGG